MKGVTPQKLQACPHCGYLVNSAGTFDGEDFAPLPGDITMCIECTGFCIFAEDMTLRKLTPDEFVELDVDARTQLLEGRRRMKEIKRLHPKDDDADTSPGA